MKSATIIACVLTLMAMGCDTGGQAQAPRDFIDRESVAIDDPVQKPLEHALGLIGLAPDKLARPCYLEANYHMVCRNPLIDRVAQSPFYLHYWAEDLSTQIQQTSTLGLYEVLNPIIGTINGGVEYASETDKVFSSGSYAAYQFLCEQYNVTPDDTVLDLITKAGFTRAFDLQLGQMIAAMAHASNLNAQAFENLSSSERSLILSQPARFFYPDKGKFRFLTAPTWTQVKLMRIAQKIDFKSLFTASQILATAVDRFAAFLNQTSLEKQARQIFVDPHKRSGIVLQIPSPIGDIIILGQDDNRFDGIGALVIDLGGDDQYKGPIAASNLVPGFVAVAIDIQGNDRYAYRRKSYTQGFGCLGIGLLADLDGSDEYYGGDMAQGCGLFGVGLLADRRGQDIYNMGLIGQGFGLFGAGLLLDTGGSDRYLVTGMGQGVGSTMGCGILSDSAGNDKYLADRHRKAGMLQADRWCHVQGAGLSIRSPDWVKDLSFYGGFGILSDGQGNDFYHANGGNCMGSSYFMSVGALVDHAGDDQYIPEQGYGVGFAVHLSNAVLIDVQGDDFYLGKTHTGGVGSDRSVAILADYQGNDIYGPSDTYIKDALAHDTAVAGKDTTESIDELVHDRLAGLSYGAAQKHKALGFLFDYRGNDKYYGRQRGWGESCGGVMPPQYPQHWSHAVLLDLGGQDYYAKTGAKNNHYFKYHGHGICYDTEHPETGVPSNGQPTNRWQMQPGHRAVRLNFQDVQSDDTALAGLGSPDLFIRFAAIGKLGQSGTKIIEPLMQILAVSNDLERNRDIIEVLGYLHERKKLDPMQHSKLVADLLKAPDPFVRKYAARLLGWWGGPEAIAGLMQSLARESDNVLAHCVWALGNIGSDVSVDALIAVLSRSGSPEVKQATIEALGSIVLQAGPPTGARRNVLREILVQGLDDPDAIIRAHAATGLYAFSGNPDVIGMMRPKLQDPDVYVRRAIAHTLARSGDKQGIPTLIESLRFPSIDTFDFYDQDLVKDIAFYCGVDFPDAQRFDHGTWRDWWQANAQHVDLAHNLTVKKQIEDAFAAFPESRGLATFERLMQTENGNLMVKRRYQRFCRDRIRYLLGHRAIERTIIERCIVLQRILNDLDPDDMKVKKQLLLFEQQLAAMH